MSTSVLIFQHGDYAEAWRRLQGGGQETYRDQRRSVDFVAGLAPEMQVTVVAFTPEAYDVTLAPGLRAIGAPFRTLDRARIAALFDAAGADLAICRGPHPAILREARRRALPVLPCFADIFANDGPRALLRNLRLRLALSGKHVPCIANHSLNASRSVRSGLFVPGARVTPWDWSRLPIAGASKAGPAAPGRITAFFAGALTANKGVGDCLGALAALRGMGRDASMTFAGPGDIAKWRAEAERLGVADAAEFIGVASHADVRRHMREHDVVIVPSRHGYAEGLPNTIYEALASRSPLIISDHPAFRGRLTPDAECLVFEAEDPAALATQIARLADDPALYAALSQASERAVGGLYVGMEWEALIAAFLADPRNETGWVQANSLERLGL